MICILVLMVRKSNKSCINLVFVPPNKAKDLSGLSSHHPDFYRMGPPIQHKEGHMPNEDSARYNGAASLAESMESTTDFA